MRLKNKIEITDFLNTVYQSKGIVWLISDQGDRYNLKSTLSRYVAIAALISDHAEELELFCENKTDESLFYDFFAQHPEVL